MGLYKRGQVWHMSFTYKGKRYRKSTETANRKLARRILDKVKGEIAEGKWFERLPGEGKTFREMMERFESEYFSNLASFKACKSYLNGLVAHFGDFTLAEITPNLVNDFKNKRKANGVKPATIQRQLAIMSRAFNLAIREWEWCKNNPVSKVTLEGPNNKRDRWLTFEEEERVLKICPIWLKEIVIFGLNTGMRLGEILSLEWNGADLFRKTIIVFKSKNNERRTIPMNETVFELLKGKAKVRSIKTDFIFYNRVHNPIDRHHVGGTFRRALKEAGIQNFCFHCCRHTFATRLVQAGKDLYKVQMLLGHKSPRMTQRYAHHYPESLRDAVEILDHIKKEYDTNQSQITKEEIK